MFCIFLSCTFLSQMTGCSAFFRNFTFLSQMTGCLAFFHNFSDASLHTVILIEFVSVLKTQTGSSSLLIVLTDLLIQ